MTSPPLPIHRRSVWRQARRAGAWLLLAPLVAAVAACTAYHERREVEAPPGLELPEAFAGAGAGASEAAPQAWWERFDDPALNAAVTRVLERNHDLRASWARLEQTRIAAEAAGAGQWPTMSLDASAGYSRSAFVVGEQVIRNDNAQYQLSVPVSYEVDLWGKVSQRVEAARLDSEAAAAELESAAMSLAAQTTETWYALVEARARQALLRSQRELSELYLELVIARFELGLAALSDVYQQEQQIEATEAQIVQTSIQREALEHGLAILLSEPPGQGRAVAGTGEQLPALPAPPDPGLPAELLARRPDLRAAQRRLAAADLRIGVAKADRLPTLRLSASVGLLGVNTLNILDILTSSLSALVSWPLLDGGARAYEVERQQAAYQELLATYGGRFLTATREVEDALSNERLQRVYIERIERQLALSRDALERVRERYVQGNADYLRVLTALNATQQLELSLLSARRQLISYRIQLYRALGGDWQTLLKRPEAL